MDIIVEIQYTNGEEKEVIEGVNGLLSVNEITEYLNKKYYNAKNIKWYERDNTTNDY